MTLNIEFMHLDMHHHSYRSDNGKCKRMSIGSNIHCPIHNCHVPGCLNGKAHTEDFCSDHATLESRK